MATRAFTATRIGPGMNRIVWTGLLNGDDGAPYSDFYTTEKGVQVEGTFGAGGTVVIEGSLEEPPTNYRTLNDPQGNALSFTSARIEKVQEPNGVIRPRATAGDGTTNLTVTMVTRKTPDV